MDCHGDEYMKSDTSFGYFPVNPTAIATGFYLTGAGVERIAPHASYPLPDHPEMYQFSWKTGRVLPEYQWVFLSSGHGEFESRETGGVHVQAGSALILLPDVWHRYRPKPHTGWTVYWLSFNGQVPHFWQQAGLLTPLCAPENLRSHVKSVRAAKLQAVGTAQLHAARSILWTSAMPGRLFLSQI